MSATDNIISGLFTTALVGGTAVFAMMLGEATAPTTEPEAVPTIAAKSVPTEYRATVVASEEDCPGATVAQGDELLCLADATATVTDAAPAVKDRKRLVVCDEGEDGITVRWVAPPVQLGPECRVVAAPAVTVSLGIETDLTAALREACAPCPVGPKSWGKCPRCILEPGGCAKACPVETPEK